ncbi:hypothetical protein P8452_30133 [Trifolium repens]|nr:hypothetical protein P8452_30133 [Trifolium repens]
MEAHSRAPSLKESFQMSREFNFIKDLNKERDIWKIAVRVIDSWTVTGTNGFQHLEMVIVDGKGDRVLAVTRYKEYEHWKEFIEEHKVYTLHNCQVYDNDLGFKPTEGPFKVVFGSGTKFTKSPEITNIPLHEFCFKNYKEVQAGKFKNNLLYEIIGVIHEVVKTQSVASGKKPCTNLILANECGDMVDVTLWEAFSIQLMNYITNRKDKGPIVLILTHAQCKLGDNGRPNFCNNWTGSKLLINLEHPAVEKFKSSFNDISSTQAATQDFSQISSSSQVSNNDVFSNLTQFKTIAQMKLFQKDSHCITIGTTKKFNPNQFGWYYESCTKCTKSSRSLGENYTCSCGEEVKVPIARFKVVVQVEYQGSKADFIFWDNECQSIIGDTAEDIRQEMKKVGEDDPKIYPTHLDKLLNLECAFKVKYQPYYRQASINKLSSDSTIINNIKIHITPSQPTPTISNSAPNSAEPSKLTTTMDNENIQCSDSTPISSKSTAKMFEPSQPTTQCSDSFVVPTVSLSASNEADFEIISNITPAKRVSTDNEIHPDTASPQINEGQLSSTRLRTKAAKGGKHVKLE